MLLKEKSQKKGEVEGIEKYSVLIFEIYIL
jgi:hypothetical protein